MVSRLAGALLRAILVGFLILVPVIVVPGTTQDTAQITAFLALLAAGFVMFEYMAPAPSLVEFRAAPPFNRIRFAGLLATVFLLSLVVRGEHGASDLTRLVQVIGLRIGEALDFPYSPVNLVVLMLPPDAPAHQVVLVRTAAGMAYLISLLTLAFFVIILKARDWPRCQGRGKAFNIWVNMPTFNPALGADLVWRLERDAVINIALGFLLPFLMPALVTAAGSLFGSVSVSNEHTMIWTVTAWAFLPAGLFMRGIALGRLAAMIRAERARYREKHAEGGFQPV